MEIDDNYGHLEPSGAAPAASTETNTFMKETLLRSPIFTNIIPNFTVWLNKPVSTVRASAASDAADQYRSLQEEDSQFDVFNDDDDDLLFGDDPPKVEPAAPAKPELAAVRLIVKVSSLLIDGVDHPFNANVRASVVLRGIRNGTTAEEDSLLVSLSSGFLLLIRVFCVPRGFKDSDYVIADDSETVLRPFVVQWWDASGSTPLFSSGKALAAHASSSAVVSASSCGVFRIHNCNHTETGILLQPHYNVTVNGSILHSCFAFPVKGHTLDNYVMFLALVFTDTRRLELCLYSWSTSDTLPESLSKSTLPLNNTFVPPVFIIALPNNNSFLFVLESELVIITIHDITSAEYNFRRTRFPGSFPTCFYHPEGPIAAEFDDDTDEVLIATDNGTIYSVVVADNNVTRVRAIMRISDPISTFSLEKGDDGFVLIYGSDMGLNREVLIQDLLDDTENQKPPYSKSLLLTDYKNWAPIMDVQVIDSYSSRNVTQHATQELWTISGVGKRARVSQLRKGHLLKRVSEPYAGLRKIEDMKLIDYDGVYYLLCTLPFQTLLLEYSPNDDEDEFAVIEDVALITDSPTLLAAVHQNLLVQVTTNTIVLSTIQEFVFSRSFEDVVITFSEMVDDIIMLVSQRTDSGASVSTIELVRIKPMSSFELDLEYDDLFEQISSVDFSAPISMIKLCRIDDELVTIVGSFDGMLELFKVSDSLEQPFAVVDLSNNFTSPVNEFSFTSLAPHDLVVVPDHQLILVSTKDGHVFYYSYEEYQLKFVNCIDFCHSEIQLCQVPDNNNCIFIVAKSIWLVDFQKHSSPEPVLFEEKNDRPTKSVLPVPAHPDSLSSQFTLIYLRDEGLSIGIVDSFRSPSIRQIHLGDNAKKFLYLPFASLFAILSSSKDVHARLRFVDRRSYKLLAHNEYSLKSSRPDSDRQIFDTNETPMCVSIWSVERNSKVSKKLLIGSSLANETGSFKILDVTKINSKEDSHPMVKLTELTSFAHAEPITNIQQIGSTILFSSGRSVYSTKYNLEERKLTNVTSLLTLSSEILSMTVKDDLYVNISTKLDSFYQFTYIRNDDTSENLSLVTRDPSPKAIVNHVSLNSKIVVGEKLHSTILILTNDNKNLVPYLTLNTSGVPRVYPANLLSSWSDKMTCNLSSSFLVINVDGEVKLVKELAKGSQEYSKLATIFKGSSDRLEFSTDRWDVQFVDKITGKGLKSINKPFFGHSVTNSSIIDYDLDEVAESVFSTTTL